MEHELSAYYDITHGVGLPVTNGRKWERIRDLQIPVTAKMVDKLSCRK
jgi:alcohol dehydrogenase YqhD (iron-dependent ADH family)